MEDAAEKIMTRRLPDQQLFAQAESVTRCQLFEISCPMVGQEYPERPLRRQVGANHGQQFCQRQLLTMPGQVSRFRCRCQVSFIERRVDNNKIEWIRERKSPDIPGKHLQPIL